MNPVERDDAVTQRVQHLGRYPARHLPVDVARLVPVVVFAVEPDGDPAPRPEQPRQTLESLLAVRRVVKYPNAVDVVETLRGKWKLENISLKKSTPTIPHILTAAFAPPPHANPH